MNTLPGVAAVVLAGGQATRMQGHDKGLLELNGKPLVARVLEVLSHQISQTVISANRNLPAYAALGAQIVVDDYSDFAGPLAGMAAAMRSVDAELLFVCPCDSPFLSDDIVTRLHRQLIATNADIAIAHDGERPQPVFAIMRCTLLPSLVKFLNSGERKIMFWYRQQKLVEVDFTDQPDTFININTPEQRTEAENRLRNQIAEKPMPERPITERQPSCQDEAEPDLLPVATAYRRLREIVDPVVEVQTVTIRESLDRVLAQDIVSPIDVPAYVNSAMDGYAVRGGDVPEHGKFSLRVVGTAWAGRPADVPVAPGQCVRIMTGAMMPEGADTVVIQEHVEARGDQIHIDTDVRAGHNVRLAGEDVRRGETIIHRGVLVRPAQLGLLASLGINRVAVFRRPVVAYFSTGDELRSLDEHAGKPLNPGELFDSNRYTLFGMLSRLGVDIVDLGVVRDDRASTREVLLQASGQADMVLTSGGVSAGAADFVTDTLRELGEVAFWKLAMRPGRPLASGRIGDALFFGLPGNPVAVMVTFYEFVQPAIRQLMGCSELFTPTILAQCATALRKSPGRIEYQRGILENIDGVPTVRTTGAQGAGRLSSMSAANCMIVLPAEMEKVEPGSMVGVQLFEGLV